MVSAIHPEFSVEHSALPKDPRVQAAASGDRAAVESLLTELLPRVRNLIRYLIRGDQHVDDIAQEALIALARGFASYRGDGTLTAWADRVVVRTAFAYLRKIRRDPAEGALGPELIALPNDDDAPDTYAMRRHLVQLLDRIPHEQRRVIVLHHVLGMRVPEIAEQLAVSPETVRSRLRLGKSKLRALQQQLSYPQTNASDQSPSGQSQRGQSQRGQPQRGQPQRGQP